LSCPVKYSKAPLFSSVQIAVARAEALDSWKVSISLPDSELLGKLPYSLSRLKSDPDPNVAILASGRFW